jgi:hypothetical protein
MVFFDAFGGLSERIAKYFSIGNEEKEVCAMQGSNLRLLACEASALPLS